jgi:2-octaprenylphenol hydroxylase
LTELSADIAVVGGGMVGAALACGLAQQGFDVALLELREPVEDWPQDSYDLRVSAITRASQHIFEHLHAWQGMQDRRATPYQKMQVWDATGSGQIQFDAADIAEPELGHIIENRIIQRSLWDQMEQLGRLQIICPARVEALTTDEHSNSLLTLEDGGQLQVSLVVAADGANSALREMAGIGTRGWLYDQTAVVATVRAEYGHQDTAWQKFMPTGPLALLPTGKDLFSIVWSTSPEQATELLEMSEQDFNALLTQTSEHRLGELKILGQRGAFPLRLQHANTYIKPGLALVGDAAHVIHPLAGQGVNLGLLDAATLIDVLVRARNRKRVLGGFPNLRRYERARMGDNVIMQTAMDGFKRLFSNQLLPLKLARNLGLGMVDHAPSIKHMIARQALGTSGELPSLAKP